MTVAPTRRPLILNGLFSFATGVISFFAADVVANVFGLGAPRAYELLGAALVAYAVGLASLAYRPSRLLPVVIGALLDIAWVLGSAVLLAVMGSRMSSTGQLIVVTVAAIVAGFAWLQLRAVARSFVDNAGPPGEYLVRVEVPTNVAADRMWSIVRELGDIQRYMPSLASSVVLDGRRTGIGAVRECEDTKGARWRERCDTWEEARAFSVVFEAQAPDFPFPFRAMRGGWEVSPTSEGSVVRVWWRVVPRHEATVGVILPVMAWRAQSDFVAIVGRMAAAATAD